MHFKAERRT
ncbi:hypothetical protein QTG54_002280 [Skeletonema marinoi]|uniref:Uncharacterized protein n=1 Tax=Skeletonema marinoi TaxID=267567 RepID=A0AAD9DGK0_9STRA|nr:hypothetical protein QTG54_002280 [Skeletonema marinoi]